MAADDGAATAPASSPHTGHLGLEGVREQAELLGGSFELSDRPGGGTVATVRWPA
jgi:signal transduction histidine kinase